MGIPESKKLDIRQLKAFSKERRMAAAYEIRRDPDLYNAVNGIGGLSENAQHGLLQGTISENDVPIRNVEVVASSRTKLSVKAYTNQYGYYKMNLDEGFYNVDINYGDIIHETNTDISNGVTETLNHDFDTFQPIKKLEPNKASNQIVEPEDNTKDENKEKE